jgi:predicted Zn-dependent peptidase
MNVRRWLFAVTAGLFLSGAVYAAATPYRLADHLKHWKFDNGFQVLFLPRQSVPFFSAVIWVNAGAVDESRGQSGIAHLLEHMAFKGTPWVGTRNWNEERKLLVEVEDVAQQLRRGDVRQSTSALTQRFMRLQNEAGRYVIPNEYDRLITLAGGQEVNATTSEDFTNYYMTLPSNQLELWAMLESQRLAYPSWREFYKERDVVAEERRMRSEDDPEGRLYEEFVAAAFKAHPYHTPTIGWMSDIQNLTTADVHDFYRRWYVPQNMVAVIVGDLNEKEVREITARYFGSLPAAASPQRAPTSEPRQTAERRVRLVFDAQPQLVMGWHKPALPARDAIICEVLQSVLAGNGRSSRLYTELVKKRNLCESVSAFSGPGDKYPNVLSIWATPRAPHSADEVEQAIWAEIDRLGRDGVTTAELEMTRAKVEAGLVRQLENNMNCAHQIGYFYLVTGDPSFIDKYLEAIRQISSADIQNVVRQYLTRENVTVATLSSNSARETDRRSGAAPRPPGQEMRYVDAEESHQ